MTIIKGRQLVPARHWVGALREIWLSILGVKLENCHDFAFVGTEPRGKIQRHFSRQFAVRRCE